MKKQERIEKAFNYFKKSYAYKMGGTQTVVLPNGKSKEFDDREYYSGRGSKYNSSIRHDNIGIVKVTRKEYTAFLAMLKEREERAKQWKIEQDEKSARLKEAEERGVYHIRNNGSFDYIELSEEERHGRFFDPERLAKTLDISINDAKLVSSQGKTYVFARKSTGELIEIYHPSLDCNDLSISVHPCTEERAKEFYSNRESWVKAPYAGVVGQTSNSNHYVC